MRPAPRRTPAHGNADRRDGQPLVITAGHRSAEVTHHRGCQVDVRRDTSSPSSNRSREVQTRRSAECLSGDA